MVADRATSPGSYGFRTSLLGPATRTAAEASARPRPIPAKASDGQWARSITRAVATSTMITSAAALTSRLAGGRRALLRLDELGATTTIGEDERQAAPATPLVERDAAVAVGAFVADPSLVDHADHPSNLFVRRLDVEDAAVGPVVLDGQ